MTHHTSLLSLRCLALWALPLGALAQQAPEPAPDPDFSLSGTLTGVSQYRLRGVSMSNARPALQASLTATHRSGFYGGLWASQLAGFGSYGGADLELDATAGYAATLGATTLDGGLTWYSFPGTRGHHYGEVFVSASQPLGDAQLKLGLNYAPRQTSIGGADNLYVYADLARPVGGTAVQLKAHVGYTRGRGSIYAGPRGHYLDYSLGAEMPFKALTFGLAWVGTRIDRAQADGYFFSAGGRPGRDLVKGALVLSVTAAF